VDRRWSALGSIIYSLIISFEVTRYRFYSKRYLYIPAIGVYIIGESRYTFGPILPQTFASLLVI